MGKAPNFDRCNEIVKAFESVIKKPKYNPNDTYFIGVDLGTAYIVTVVMNQDGQPIAGRVQNAKVVRDGMVVDYVGAVDIVRRMKQELEEELHSELRYASAAIPPGTDSVDGGAVKNVVEGAGYEVIGVLEESTAANELLEIKNGAIVDIGGGTTGISIFKKGKCIYTADEPTGGTHFSLVITGAYKIDFDEADQLKRDYKKHKELAPVITPVIDKIASIINRHTQGKYKVDTVVLVGGTACFTDIEEVVQKQIKASVYKPFNPLFVTPLGIALWCTKQKDKIL